jgi:hypothetical protein
MASIHEGPSETARTLSGSDAVPKAVLGVMLKLSVATGSVSFDVPDGCQMRSATGAGSLPALAGRGGLVGGGEGPSEAPVRDVEG